MILMPTNNRILRICGFLFQGIKKRLGAPILKHNYSIDDNDLPFLFFFCLKVK